MKIAMITALLSLTCPLAQAQQPDTFPSSALNVQIFERASSTSPIEQWKSVGGNVVFEYSDSSSRASREFSSTTQLPFINSNGKMLTRLTVSDSAGNPIVYCNDIQLGFPYMALGLYQRQVPMEARFARSIELKVVRTQDGSAMTDVQFGDSGIGCGKPMN